MASNRACVTLDSDLSNFRHLLFILDQLLGDKMETKMETFLVVINLRATFKQLLRKF